MKDTFRSPFVVFLFALQIAHPAWSRESAPKYADVGEVTMEDFLNLMTAAPAKKSLTTREAPGVVTIITEEEIAASGARDIMDVLRFVPGFAFGLDNYSNKGPGFRGIWGMEGKILLLVDGQPYNELLYSTLPLGNHNLPMDQIKQIEVIRGPGSAIYGGLAELAVINITTKGAEDINGAEISLVNGQMNRTFSRREGSLSFGKKAGDTSVSAGVLLGEGNGSDRIYTDIHGSQYDMAEYSELRPAHINLGVAHGNLKTRAIMDRQEIAQRDAFTDVVADTIRYSFTTYHFNAKYDHRVGDALTITPDVTYMQQRPWLERSPFLTLDKRVERYTGNLSLSYDATESLNVLAGAEIYQDRARATEDTDPRYLFQFGRRMVRYTNRAFFSQGLLNLPIANLMVGARWDDHSEVGSSFVPRAALTKVMNPFHFKLLYSEAFRAPGIENIHYNTDIEPERTTVYEFEAGCQLNRTMFLSANVFDVKLEKPIIFFYDEPTDTEGYLNYDRTGSRGVEAVYSIKDRWGQTGLTYSFYEPHKNTVDAYRAGGKEHVYLAFPAHKATLSAGVKVGGKTTVSPSAAYLSPRYGYASVDSAGEPVLKKFDPSLLANLFVNFRNVFADGLTIGLGVFDILGENHEFIQPYNSLHAPLPGPSREYVLKVSYRFLDFNDNP
ncbi:MAG: TonB-dependent receptor plug domain-containing protein [Elusimicrobiota bacterium]